MTVSRPARRCLTSFISRENATATPIYPWRRPKTKADYLSSEQFKSQLELNNIVLNKTYKIDPNQKIYTVFTKEATGAYWDGYNGL